MVGSGCCGLLSIALVGTALIASESVARTEEFGIHESSSSWVTNLDQPDRIPGIDQGAAVHVRLLAGPPEGVPFMIWCDDSSALSGAGGGEGSGRAYYRGKLTRKGETLLEFAIETTDGKTGTMVVDGVPCDLGKGRLFLISTRSKTVKFVQLDIDLSRFSEGIKGHEKLIRFARNQQEIRKFWTSASQTGAE